MAWAWPDSGAMSGVPGAPYNAAGASPHAHAASHAASTARIADILRSGDPWPKADSMSPLDLAHQLVSQQRHMVDHGGAGVLPMAGGQKSVLATGPSISSTPLPAALLPGPAGLESKAVSQLAERVSLLLAGVQQQSTAEKEDMERQFVQRDSKVESRMISLEARVAACEEQAAELQRRESESASAEAARALREARALVGGAVAEVQAQCREDRTDLMEGQHEQARQLEEFGKHAKGQAYRLQQAEGTLEEQVQQTRQLEEALQMVLDREQPPPWYGELESAVARLEYRFEEQRGAAEFTIGRYRTDGDSMRMRMESLREDALCAVDRRIDQELERLLPSRPSDVFKVDLHKDKDVSRRIDDVEARVAAIRMRADSHDNRLATVAERAEAACQQALEGARQAASSQREDILSEVDCQLRILRQRVEAVGELCEELSLRQMCKAPSRWPPIGMEGEPP